MKEKNILKIKSVDYSDTKSKPKFRMINLLFKQIYWIIDESEDSKDVPKTKSKELIKT